MADLLVDYKCCLGSALESIAKENMHPFVMVFTGITAFTSMARFKMPACHGFAHMRCYLKA